jgi:hypothetical protein
MMDSKNTKIYSDSTRTQKDRNLGLVFLVGGLFLMLTAAALLVVFGILFPPASIPLIGTLIAGVALPGTGILLETIIIPACCVSIALIGLASLIVGSISMKNITSPGDNTINQAIAKTTALKEDNTSKIEITIMYLDPGTFVYATLTKNESECIYEFINTHNDGNKNARVNIFITDKTPMYHVSSSVTATIVNALETKAKNLIIITKEILENGGHQLDTTTTKQQSQSTEPPSPSQ